LFLFKLGVIESVLIPTFSCSDPLITYSFSSG